MLLGAHVSTAGGMRNAPGRGTEIGATAVQIFTKQPNRWADKPIDPQDAADFRAGIAEAGIGFVCSHDSYLINLASPDETLCERSYASFVSELTRSRELGLDGTVTHPGNATDGDRPRGLKRNAELIERALREVGGEGRVFIETTAGSGTALGCTFEELAEIMERISADVRDRVAVCLDTCHVYSAGYDIREDYDGVIDAFEAAIGLDRLAVVHLNDSQRPFGSRKDRHQHIGAGTLGEEPFRRIMRDERFSGVPKVLETPKEDDAALYDRKNLSLLRSFLADVA